MKVKSESEVAQSCPTLSDPMDCSLPASSVHGIFQARVLEWDAIAFSEESTCNVGNLGSIPELGRYPGEGNNYSNILTWRIPWTIQSMEYQRIKHS